MFGKGDGGWGKGGWDALWGMIVMVSWWGLECEFVLGEKRYCGGGGGGFLRWIYGKG